MLDKLVSEAMEKCPTFRTNRPQGQYLCELHVGWVSAFLVYIVNLSLQSSFPVY